MGCISAICRFSAVFVPLFAIILGMFIVGQPTALFKYLDEKPDEIGNLRAKGILPAFHSHEAWRFQMDDIPDGSLKGKVFIVTGANVGLGYWTALHIASKGGVVHLGCRSPAKCEKAAADIRLAIGTKGTVQPAIMDLASLASVSAFAEQFLASNKALHSLILNAGIMRTPFGLTKDGIEQQLGVNHFGHVHLVNLLLPLLKSTGTDAAPATISVVSSSAHFRTYPEGVRTTLEAINDEATYDAADAYGQSKLANILYTQELAERLKGENVLVNAAHPGGVNTELARHIIAELYEKTGPTVGYLLEVVFGFIVKTMFWQPEDAALTQIFTAVGPKLLKEKISGQYYHPIARPTAPHAVHANNKDLQKRFYDFTQSTLEKLVKRV